MMPRASLERKSWGQAPVRCLEFRILADHGPKIQTEAPPQISLDVRNQNLSEKRIHQICAWTPARRRCGECWSREPSCSHSHGDVLALRIAGFRYFDCYLIVIFLSPVGDESRSRRLCARPQIAGGG